MKILMVTRETQAEKRYGLGRSLMPLIEELRRRDITVDYICQSDLGPRASRWQHHLYRLLAALPGSSKSATDFPTLFHVLIERLNMGRVAAKLAAKQKFTHVHCHDPIIAAGFRFFALLYPKHHASCWGVTEHGFGCYMNAMQDDGMKISPNVMRLLRNWEARTLRAASWVTAPTFSGITQIAKDLGVSPIPENWQVVTHARPRLNHYQKQDARTQLGWNAECIYIIGVGRIAAVKQFPLLIEACAKLKANKQLKLVILGEGDYGHLQKEAQQFAFADKLQFATTEDIGLYLCAANIYVSTSASESFGMANFEALTAGTAAICTAVGGVPDVVGNGAILVPPCAKEITHAIQHMLDNKKHRNATAQNGLERAKLWPDIIQITDSYEAIYRQATTNKNSRTGAVPTTNATDAH